ncbi:36899_t:CDS:2 [Racocetra persica]|uniref:36899_t:CDS:1 n=1 Tax=Racocetra persica TaxID=160502 RepID=A0ACA9NKT6_9GLOM|nr:36899_t:CDS:2 [Racocetra persica]
METTTTLPEQLEEDSKDEETTLSEQLEKCLKDKDIKHYDFPRSENFRIIGKGGFAVVYLATFEEEQYALKSFQQNLHFDKREFKYFMKELEMLYKLKDHPNIIKFYGISRNMLEGNVMLVLQYANGGNLRNHLFKKQKNNIYSILWSELIKIAIDIIKGLKHLHENDIIHRDLHSKNILINNGNALISDLGISKRIDASITSSEFKPRGVVAYTEPQYFIAPQYSENSKRDDQEKIQRDKKSDIIA